MLSILLIIAGQNTTQTVSPLRAYLVSWCLLCKGCKCAPGGVVRSLFMNHASYTAFSLLFGGSAPKRSLHLLDKAENRETLMWSIKDLLCTIPWATKCKQMFLDCHYLERMCHSGNSDIQSFFQMLTRYSTGWFSAGLIICLFLPWSRHTASVVNFPCPAALTASKSFCPTLSLLSNHLVLKNSISWEDRGNATATGTYFCQ